VPVKIIGSFTVIPETLVNVTLLPVLSVEDTVLETVVGVHANCNDCDAGEILL
jgi:hypothetical protein